MCRLSLTRRLPDEFSGSEEEAVSAGSEEEEEAWLLTSGPRSLSASSHGSPSVSLSPPARASPLSPPNGTRADLEDWLSNSGSGLQNATPERAPPPPVPRLGGKPLESKRERATSPLSRCYPTIGGDGEWKQILSSDREWVGLLGDVTGGGGRFPRPAGERAK